MKYVTSTALNRKHISHRLRESWLIFTANVRIGDKKKSSASLLEIEIRFTVSSHMNITRRCQGIWLHIVETSCYNAAHQVQYKGTCTYVSRTKIYTLHTETSPRTRCYNPALGVTRAMSYPKGGVTMSQQELQFGFPRILAMAKSLGFPPSNGISSYPNASSFSFLLASFCCVLAKALVWVLLQRC